MSVSNIQGSGRIQREELYRDLVFSLSRRSTCSRAAVGALVTAGNRILSMGYNGAPGGVDHCIDVGCLLGEDGRCKRTIHAEVNAILIAQSFQGMILGPRVLWCTHIPCLDCIKLCISAGIRQVYYWIHREYKDGSDIFLDSLPFNQSELDPTQMLITKKKVITLEQLRT